MTVPSASGDAGPVCLDEVSPPAVQSRNKASAASRAVVGVHNGHNAAAALVQNGELTFALQEERLTRVKNQGGLPLKTLKLIAGSMPGHEATGAEVPVAFGGKNLTLCEWERTAILAAYARTSRGFLPRLKQLARQNPAISNSINRYKYKKLEAELSAAFDGEPAQASGFDHHLCHAAAAYYGWGRMNEDILVLTCDGGGDCVCATVNIGRKGSLSTIARTDESHSVGVFFAKITYLLGMVPLEHEYKVMGLAPYSDRSTGSQQMAQEFANLFEFDPHNPLSWRRRNGSPPMQFASLYLDRMIHQKRFDHIAGGAQLFIEQFLSQWVRHCVRETGVRKVALAGGVFMNVKANKCILELPEVDELFVFPSCGDETNSIASAWLLYQQAFNEVTRPLQSLYLGTAYSQSDVETALQNYKFTHEVRVTEPADVESQVAELLAKGNIVARFKDRCEFGARALGNRSILANASHSDSVRTINEMIKCRDFWMPFAPSVLQERSDEYFDKPKPMPAPYMIMTFDTREDRRAAIPAAIHPYDFTGRPQEVTEGSNRDYYRLLKHYEALTGHGIILNTSFNLHGEPVVCSPQDALRVFDLSGLEHLALENALISKT